jgi:hypothetical protein
MKQIEESTIEIRLPRASARVLAAVAAYERTLVLTRRAAAARATRPSPAGDVPAAGSADLPRIA